jgi:hypothetical protein
MSRTANCLTAAARSAGLKACSLTGSKVRLNWRAADVGRSRLEGVFILLLPNDGSIARRGSPEAGVDQLTLKVDERFHRDPRRSHFHARTEDRVQHPFRQYRDVAGR